MYLNELSLFKKYIYLYVFLLPFNMVNSQMAILSLILLVFWLKNFNYKTIEKIKEIKLYKPIILFILFILFSYLSFLWSNNIEDALKSFSKYKYYWILLPVMFTSLNKKDAINLIYVFTLSISVYAFFSLLIYFSMLYIPGSSSSDPKGILLYAVTTPLMGIGLLNSIIILKYDKSKKIRLIFFITTIICLSAFLINNGRAGQIATLLTIFTYVLLNIKMINFKIIITLIVFLISSLFVLENMNKLERIKGGINELTHLETNNFKGSWGIRAYLWYAGYDILKKNPIIGIGAGDVYDKIEEYSLKNKNRAAEFRNFHNYHMDTIVKYGILGYILFWSSIFILLKSLFSNKFYFSLAFSFFGISFYCSLFDDLLSMKPFNNIYFILIILFSILIYKEKKIFSNSN